MFLNRPDRYEYYLYCRNRRNRRLTFFIAAVLLVLAIGGARHASSHAHHPADPATPAPSATPAPTPASRVRPTAAVGLSWVRFHGIELPASAQDGPRHTAGGLAWGFADTPRGALLAAVNITVRTAAQWGPTVWGSTIRRQVTGPDRAALLAADAPSWVALHAAALVPGSHPAGRGDASEVAWRFESWTPDAAVADIVTEAPGAGGIPVRVVTGIRLAWQDGDWRVLAPPGGTWASSAAALSSLAGFTPFPDER